MSHDDLTARVLSIIAEAQQLPPEAVTLDSTFDELQIDSLGAVGILSEMESAFDIEVPNQLVLKIRTIREVVGAVRTLAAPAADRGAVARPAPDAPAAARPAMH
jgi:acyl carrier protein